MNEQAAVTDRRDKGVGWPDVGLAFLAALILYGVGIAIIRSVPDDRSELAGIVQYGVSGLAPLGAFAAVLWLRVKDPRALGLRRVTGKWVLLSIGAGIVVILLNILVTIVVISLTGPPSNLQADYQAAASGGALSLITAIAVGAVLTPVGEEFLFRGVLATSLNRYGPWIAVLGSSAVFALAHGINYILPVAFVVGVVAALLLRRTGSVWPGVIVHATNNGYSVIVPAILGVAS
ncbi:type II CAAX endopeptidase family protein [Nonomuraea maheshkhaliensis]|uniref:Type II CAAX endopeptidase family protein n=1 Tax=Nonomuraea maheshkhaliensis TaxID=419590 RepID=A0ABN2EXX8_9ACTN